MVHISTAYSQVDKMDSIIEEIIYDPPISPERVIAMTRWAISRTWSFYWPCMSRQENHHWPLSTYVTINFVGSAVCFILRSEGTFLSTSQVFLMCVCSLMNDQELEALTPHLLKAHNRPNTYTLTKAIAEKLFADEHEHVPVCIVRPSVITASQEEPFPVSKTTSVS